MSTMICLFLFRFQFRLFLSLSISAVFVIFFCSQPYMFGMFFLVITRVNHNQSRLPALAWTFRCFSSSIITMAGPASALLKADISKVPTCVREYNLTTKTTLSLITFRSSTRIYINMGQKKARHKKSHILWLDLSLCLDRKLNANALLSFYVFSLSSIMVLSHSIFCLDSFLILNFIVIFISLHMIIFPIPLVFRALDRIAIVVMFWDRLSFFFLEHIEMSGRHVEAPV